MLHPLARGRALLLGALLVLVPCAALAPVGAAPNAPEYTYTYHPGFVDTGHDVIAPANMTRAAAEARCTQLARCRAITYNGTNTTSNTVKVYVTAVICVTLQSLHTYLRWLAKLTACS